MTNTSRRVFLKAAGALALAAPTVSLVTPSARATPDTMKAAIDKVVAAIGFQLAFFQGRHLIHGGEDCASAALHHQIFKVTHGKNR